MRLKRRKYQHEQDYWRIRQFLREVFLLNDRREICWPLYRWDYWRWYINDNFYHFRLEAAVFLWESEDGQLGAVLHPDGAGEAFLQIHPGFHSTHLEVEMISTAETQYAVRLPTGAQHLTLWVHASEIQRQDLLTRRGYARGGSPEYQLRRTMELPIPEDYPPPGYQIRSLGNDCELPARSRLSWKTFHPDDPGESYPGWEWYRGVQRIPLYRRDLDLVAVAPDGELAAFCTLWFDDATRSAAFEPLGTHPDHQHRGLGQAIVAEGLRRVESLGANLVTVESCSPATRDFYASLGFTDDALSEPWRKTW